MAYITNIGVNTEMPFYFCFSDVPGYILLVFFKMFTFSNFQWHAKVQKMKYLMFEQCAKAHMRFFVKVRILAKPVQ